MSLVSTMQRQFTVHDIRHAAPAFYIVTVTFIAAFAVCTALGFVDPRLFNGVSVWEKPAKFFLSLGVHAATLGWGLTFLTQADLASKGIRRAAQLFAVSSVAEMIWIAGYAAQGSASHFNLTDPLAAAIYPVMGVVAVSLTALTIYIGWRILKSAPGIMQFATGTGFILSGILTTIVAGYMSSQTGHSIGGDPTDATGLPFFHWSTTGGDLRVSHFAALHIAQALPLLAWLWPDRRVVTIGAVASILIVAALFAQALAGVPFLRS